MRQIRWTTEASDQLETAVKHIQQDDPAAARNVAQAVIDRIEQLAAFPGLGRPGEVNGTRELISPPYVVVYRSNRRLSKFCTSGTGRKTGADISQRVLGATRGSHTTALPFQALSRDYLRNRLLASLDMKFQLRDSLELMTERPSLR